MTTDALLVVKCLFTDIWSMFTSWHIPGTSITPAAWAVFCLAFARAYRYVKAELSSGGSDGGGSKDG